MHRCPRCTGFEAAIREKQGRIVHLLRIIEKGHAGVASARTQLAAVKPKLTEDRRLLAEHVEEMSS